MERISPVSKTNGLDHCTSQPPAKSIQHTHLRSKSYKSKNQREKSFQFLKNSSWIDEKTEEKKSKNLWIWKNSPISRICNIISQERFKDLGAKYVNSPIWPRKSKKLCSFINFLERFGRDLPWWRLAWSNYWRNWKKMKALWQKQRRRAKNQIYSWWNRERGRDQGDVGAEKAREKRKEILFSLVFLCSFSCIKDLLIYHMYKRKGHTTRGSGNSPRFLDFGISSLSPKMLTSI